MKKANGWIRQSHHKLRPYIIGLLTLLALSVSSSAVITVKPDGTGDFTTIQAAVDSVPQGNTKPVVISIKPGIYKERILVPCRSRDQESGVRGQESRARGQGSDSPDP